ncbi:MAG: hypothetical protein Q8Q09_01670 [Deltaproteobacteria bacterium]|nr:hypothetical protein [Deltaproteobacteria bacterium]
MNLSMVSAATQFPLQPPGQPSEPQSGPGVCVNDKVRTLSSGLNPFRFVRGALKFNVANQGEPLKLAMSAQALTLFDKGINEDSANAGLGIFGASLTETDTDASKDGALVPNKYQFEMMGIGIIVGRPIAKPITGDGVGRRVWFKSYDAELQAAVLEHSALAIQYPDGQSINYEIGPPILWPGHGGAIELAKVSNGSPIVSAYMPFRAAGNTGGRSSDDKIEMAVRVPRSVEIESESGATQTQPGDVYVPFHVVLFGRPLELVAG